SYCKEQSLFRTAESPEPQFTDGVELDLAKVQPSLAGPRRPQDRVDLSSARSEFRRELAKEVINEHEKIDPVRIEKWIGEGGSTEKASHDPLPASDLGHLAHRAEIETEFGPADLGHGSVIIAAITSCTNTSNPSVMLGAGLLAKKAVEKGLTTRPWVKTSLAPGSKVVTDYYRDSGLDRYLDALRFNLVGYGCTTCIGNSGPLP